jgi:hypothetical protein
MIPPGRAVMGILGAGVVWPPAWVLAAAAGRWRARFAAVTAGVSAALLAFGLHLWMWRWCRQVMT